MTSKNTHRRCVFSVELFFNTHNTLLSIHSFEYGHFCLASPRFKEHLNSHEPKEVLSPEEYEELRTLCRQSQKAERAEQAQEEEKERPPGEEEPATPEGTDTVSST